MPSLSELSAIYTQRPYAPAQETNAQLGAGFSQLGGAIEYGREQARQNAPVSPWQEAVMRLMAGHDPKMVANDTKAKLGGMSGNTPIQAGPPQNAVMPPGQAQMTQPSLGSQVSDSYGQTGSQRPSQAPAPFVSAPGSRMSNLSAATQPTEAPGDIYSGMTNRDFHDYMNAMNMVRSHQPKETRDRLAEILLAGNLRNQGNETTATISAGAKVEAAGIGAAAKDNATEAKAKTDAEKLAETKNKNEETKRYHTGYLAYLNDKLSVTRDYYKQRGSKDSALDALIKIAQGKISVYKGNSSQPLEVLTKQGQDQIEMSRHDAEEAVQAVQDYMKAHPSTKQTTEQEGSKTKASGTTKNVKGHSVGDKLKANGINIKVTGVNEKGEITSYDEVK